MRFSASQVCYNPRMNIAIVGGQGKMGMLVEHLLGKHGMQVFPVGRKTKNINAVIKKCDVVIFSIPSAAFADLGSMLDEKALKGKLLVDLSSQVLGQAKKLAALSESVGFIHFLFGPDIQNIRNQNIIVSADLPDSRFASIVDALKKEGANVNSSSAEHHDYMMGLVQALSQFSSISLAKTVSESNTNKKELDDFSSITFSLNASAISRIVKQDAKLWAAIQFHNDFFTDILDAHVSTIESLRKFVTEKDYEGFKKMFETVAAFWKDEKESVMVISETNREIDRKNSKRNGSSSQSVAVLGPKGSYSEEASLKYDPTTEPVFYDSIAEIIHALAAGSESAAILPMENSIQGTILETLDGIYYNDLKISDEITVDIHHSIAGIDRKLAAKDVRTIYSHPQSLGQCAGYIRKQYPHAKLILTPSNPAAFKKIRDEGLTDALAIGPKICADIYGLSIIEEDIQDTKNNQTLFVAVSKKPSGKASKGTLQSSLLVIDPKENRPGLLHDVLSIFKDADINLLKLESRPSRSKLGTYIFYLKADIAKKDKKLDPILKQLQKFGKVTMLSN